MTDKPKKEPFLELTPTQVNTATGSLSAIAESSAASGWTEVESSARSVNITIINHTAPTQQGPTATFTREEFEALQRQIGDLNSELRDRVDPAKISRDCVKNYRECCERVGSRYDPACWVAYIQCLRAITPKGDKHLHVGGG